MDAALDVLEKRNWDVDGAISRRHMAEALEAAWEKMPSKRHIPDGYMSLDECRRLADTYSGGEGTHPLARHRDSMG